MSRVIDRRKGKRVVGMSEEGMVRGRGSETT